MKILVTGTAGFIGMHTALKLASEGHEVTGLDNINSYYDTSLKYARLLQQGIKKEDIFYNKKINGTNNIAFIELDVQDAGNLSALFAKEKFDKVVHLAAQAGVRYSITNPRDYIDSNIIGFFNILEACRNFSIQHLVYASSSSVYGNSVSTPFHENEKTDSPISFYAATKKSNEVMAHTYAHLYNIKCTGLRFFTVYGPWGRPDMALFMFTDNILKGQPIPVFNEGNLLRDFTYIDDIVEGIARVTLKSKQDPLYKIYNIGHGKPVKLMDFIKAIETACHTKAKLEFKPMQPGDVYTTYSDTESLLNDFGYNPKISIETGVANFVNWYTNYFKK